MVSFVCNYCQETLKKPKLDMHAQRCRNASFSCIDCSVDFTGTSYRQHTSCISEAEKYEGKLYKGKNSVGNKSQQNKQQKQQKQQQKPKSTVDQLTAVAREKEEAVVQTTDAADATKRKSKSKSDDGKKSKKAKSGWETEDLPRDPVDALACAIAADIGASGEEKDRSFDAMKKRCIKMVKSHPKNTAPKSDLKENFDKAVVAALSAGKVQLSK
ncbi:hypothetical protein LPJ53_001792 [Coemansia erecta]|uniref:Zinc finger C2H2 LYAR-type domain-containing protein n=1 Tax=Coemansia erecta TaxID=147472 RepID=A0A9W8CU58_9FUNG|nr:hypothetical protein LPJ53_001792 [Coemansia erecta]